ncbi:amino acid carrier protein [Luminiphilus syltensis NOR5-1B]|uniref:Amino acid carrier protein n=1 Tax=Luminiphilus syltensis NOR5-1B TaxID=565045 RepID=B8KRN4_9GAMM|nr:sodium:alanine symporter family protein [Luminiphilus syltensis]EED36991.1 amino acid carrier protein [Luminiphilus syltensis NOR5-1B]
MEAVITTINGYAWGPPMLVLLVGTGIYLTLGLGFLTFTRIPTAFRLLLGGFSGHGDGDIPPFRALMTSLSATIGTGNIAGVATAITLGGPGALFWMWITALFGMATKYAEGVLAVNYRERDALGGYSGGPMYYIRNGLGSNYRWLATAFAIFGAMAGFGLANTVQSNSVAQVLSDNVGIPWEATGVVLMILVGSVILGGIQRIAATAAAIVPTMALAYVLMSVIVIAMHIEAVPAAFVTIIDSAFNGASAAGGFAGATVWAAIRFGVARGIFSNEAGLGSAPIAHAAAKTEEPVEQGMIAMLGTLIDTLIICTMTGLVIVLTGVLDSGTSGASLTAMAFGSTFPGGEWVVTIGAVVFAITTMIGWSFYGERCVVYLVGTRGILPFRILWVLAIPVGAGLNLGIVWLIADTLNAFMAIPNLIALLLLSPVVFRLSREYFSADSKPQLAGGED